MYNKFVLADVIFIKMADMKVGKGQIQNIVIQWNRLSSYLHFDHKLSFLDRVGHEIRLLVLAAAIFKNGGC